MSSESIAECLYYIANQYGFYGNIFILISGLISNIFLILIFTNVRIFRGNQCSFYLMIESFSNIGLLSSICSSNILARILGYDPVIVSIIWCKIRAYIAQTCGVCSLYIVCSVAFDQYLSTNHRYHFRQFSTMKLANRLTSFIICFWLLHNIVYLVFSQNESIMGCTIYNSILKKYLTFFYYPVLSNALPFIFTITWSLLAYRNVRRIVRRQIPLTRRRLDRQLTAMVLARVISITILGIPFICTMLYQLNLNNNEDNYLELSIANLLATIFYFFLYLNFSVNEKI